MGKENTDTSQSVFIRQSSGLVREVSPWASFFATFGLVTGGIPILIVEWLYLAPGANWALSYLISLVPTMGMAFLFYLASISTPRAGGDYVFNARSSHPLVGFTNYWALWIAFSLSLGLYSYLAAQWFAYLFTGIGLYSSNTFLINFGNFFGSNIGSVIVGIIVLVLSAFIAVLGKYGWKFIAITGIISIITTLITFIVLAMITPSSFSSALSSFTGLHDAYSSVITYASSKGLSFLPELQASLIAIPVVWYYFTWYNLPASWSGEMKKVKFNSLLSIIISVIFIGIYYILFTFLNIHAFGEKFLVSWSYISSNSLNDTVYNSLSSIGPFTPFFALLVNHSLIVFVLMWIAFWLPNFYSNLTLVISLTRYLFSWSFDRIMPESFADVNDKLHIPVKATLLTFIVGLIGVLLYAFVPEISIVDVTVVFQVGYAVFALTTALMPFIKKDMYRRVSASKTKIMGIPLVSLIGFSVFGFLVYSLLITWNNPVLLPVNLLTFVSLIAMYGSGIGIYFLAKYMNSRKGIEMNLVFKEIPPE
ncbi:APC family permease [Acidianus sp. RZ1]|uniref:APC family permease n=1 Tax=Acidianus sp. RZ1 TaxID=1540082 RepID=UPI0014912388|nr:APC family permease [Acidianus sp. RZ1]NON62641.1 APC family permease [Acidianus sp. RZ1]